MEKESQPKLRLTPPEPDIGPVDGFIRPDDRSQENRDRPKDIFGYAEFGGRLANIARNLQTPLVLALTGGWGSGKSVFAKQWAGELRKKWAEDGDNRKPEDAPVIYFDAFANDHLQNAFSALVREVMAFIGRRERMADKAEKSVGRIAKGTVSALVESAARYASGGMVGAADIVGAMKNPLDKQVEEAQEGIGVLQKFRDALEEAAAGLGGGQPLVFIVDELDRCRPDFALELLEKIKHLFLVPNVCFVVVTNLEQFGAVVQRAYGYNESEARVYLEKFFHHSFRIPFSSLSSQSPSRYIRYLWESMNFESSAFHMRQEIERISAYYGFSLRDLEQIFACATVYLAGEHKNSFPGHSTGVYMTAALFALRKIYPQVYLRILSQGTVGSDNPPQELNWEDLPEDLKKKEKPLSRLMALTKEVMDDEENMFYSGMSYFGSDNSAKDRKRHLAEIAQESIEMWSRR